MGRRWMLAGLVAVAALPGACGPKAPDGQLLSLTPPPLAAGEYIDSFTVATQGVEILAVCHVPFGWKTTAGIEDSVTGELSGQAGLGASYLSAESRNLGQLGGLFLVRIRDGAPGGSKTLPPTFAVTMTVGRYGDEAVEPRTVKLDASSIVRTPAARCPQPRS